MTLKIFEIEEEAVAAVSRRAVKLGGQPLSPEQEHAVRAVMRDIGIGLRALAKLAGYEEER